MQENMQIIHVHVPQKDGDKFSMIATVGYEDRIELVLKSDYEKLLKENKALVKRLKLTEQVEKPRLR